MITHTNDISALKQHPVLNSGCRTFLGNPEEVCFCVRCCSMHPPAVITPRGPLCLECAETHPNEVVRRFAVNYRRNQIVGVKDYSPASSDREKLIRSGSRRQRTSYKELNAKLLILEIPELQTNYLTVNQISNKLNSIRAEKDGLVFNSIHISALLKDLSEKNQLYRFKEPHSSSRLFVYTLDFEVYNRHAQLYRILG